MPPRPRPLLDRFFDNCIPEPNSGCWLWTGHIPKTGYGQFRMTTNPTDRSIGSHRASWLLHCGEIPPGLCVCHKCDNRLCVNPAHLFLGTHGDNNRDAARKGRHNWKGRPRPGLLRGDRHHAAKLTQDKVAVIRSSDARGVDLAREYGVSTVTVSRIRRGVIWRETA